MIVDCDECTVRGDACRDCVVTVLLGEPGMPSRHGSAASGSARRIELEQAERDAMDVLAEGGLVPRLRLVTSAIPDPVDGSDAPLHRGHRHAAG